MATSEPEPDVPTVSRLVTAAEAGASTEPARAVTVGPPARDSVVRCIWLSEEGRGPMCCTVPAVWRVSRLVIGVAAAASVAAGCGSRPVSPASGPSSPAAAAAHRPAALTPTEKPPSASALAAATRRGQRAETREAGAPAGGFGALGPDAAWVLDGNGLFTTADAGARWTRITPPVADPLANILGVTFSGPDDGWVIVVHPESATAMLSIDRTTDGGRSWQAAAEPAAGNSITTASISFAGPSTGFVAVNRYQQPHALVLATSDGGMHWRLVTQSAPLVGSGIKFTSAADGWGIDPSGRLYRTTDAGLTWSEPRLPGFEPHGPRADPRSTGSASLPTFYGTRGVLLVRGPGTVIPWGPSLVETTEDGGRSWQSHPLPFNPEAPYYGSAAQMPFAAPGPGAWLYFGSGELGDNTDARVTFLRVTGDGGREWTTILPNLGVTGVQSLSFATAADGWAVVSTTGGTAVLLRTSDGGRQFTALRPPG